MRFSHAKGRLAEFATALAYVLSGYRVLAMNWRCRWGELDLVVEKGKQLVFVEVRYRGGDEFGGAVMSLDKNKMHKLRRAVAAYLSAKGCWGRPVRLDFVAWERKGFIPWPRFFKGVHVDFQ